MLLRRLFAGLRGQGKLAELASAVAARSRHSVWQRVAPRVVMMDGAEARGYIRARAAGVVRAEAVAIAADQGGVNDQWLKQLVDESMEVVVTQVVIQARNARAARRSLRRAA
jgi:hypothetical protein